MEAFVKLNKFIEERLQITSYPIKVLLLFSLVVSFSMILALTVDIIHSFSEIKREVRTAAERAVAFRSFAVRDVILEIFRTDIALTRLIKSEGPQVVEKLVGNALDCVVGENFQYGSYDKDLIKEALRSSAGKRMYFHLDPENWIGISVIDLDGFVVAFCRRVPHIEVILSGKLGAIAKYGARFYLGEKPAVPEGAIVVSQEKSYTNANMYVVIPFKNVLMTLVAERFILYVRLYLVFVLFLTISYLLWSKLVNFPITKLKETVEELEKGNYDVDFEPIRSAKDEFGYIARLLEEFAHETKGRIEKLQLMMRTALGTVSAPEEVHSFVKDTLNKVDELFKTQGSLLIMEENISEKTVLLVKSEKLDPSEVPPLLDLIRNQKERGLSQTKEEPFCVSVEREDACVSMVLFSLDQYVSGAVAIVFRGNKPSEMEQGYIRIICQHIINTLRLSHLASVDPLTGIPNRRVLEYDLNRLGKLARRYSKPLSLIMIDIDNFKHVNDTYGHPVGDEVLKRVARIIRESVRDSDTVYRYGGEEFAILCPETDKEGAFELAERIRKVIRNTSFKVDLDRDLLITVSIGVANFPEDTSDPQELIAIADISLYRAKREGKDRTVVLYGSEDKEIVISSFRTEKVVRQLIRERKVGYQLQPIVDLQKDYIFGYELLFRVVENGHLKPLGAFSSSFEDPVAIEEIDLCTLDFLRKILADPSMRDMCFFINVSPKSLEKGRIIEILDKIPKHQRSRVFVEITERETFADPLVAINYLDILRDMNYRVVMDDFGSGFSSIISMRSFVKYLDMIKVDGLLVKNVSKDPYNRAILEGIRAMASKFSMPIVAEYIENESDLKVVKSMEIRFGQGFYFRKLFKEFRL